MYRNTLYSLVLLLGVCVLLPSGSSATDIYADGEIIVSLAPGHDIEEVNARWGTTTLEAYPEVNLYLLFAEDVGDLELFAAQMELEDPAVSEAEANYFEDTPEGIRQMVIIAVGGTLVDYEDQEISSRIGLDQAHTIARGQGVVVGVLDTGVDPDHVAYAGQLSPDGFDFVDNDSLPWEEADGIDDDGDGLTDDGFAHGTMVAGIVALVAPEATILPVRVLDDEGRGDAFRVAIAVRYAVDHGANVINMSFGVPRTISFIGHQVSYADSFGVVVVAGAGNDSTDSPVYYPGAHSKAMLITALDSVDVKAGFADWNSKTHVSAPGTGVRSAYPGGDWGLGAGCSFATPFVSGEAALILSIAPNASKEFVEDQIEMAVDPIDQIPENEPFEGKLGSGRIFVPLAVEGLVASVGEAHSHRPAIQVYPNPSTRLVHFSIPVQGPHMTLEASIYSPAGRLVRTIRSSGAALSWDGLDLSGREVIPGVYYALVRHGARTYRASLHMVR